MPEHTPPIKSVPDEFSDFRSPDSASFDALVRALDRAYHRPWVMFGRSLLYGMGVVLGGTIGSAIVFAGLFYFLRSVDFTPYADGLRQLIIPDNIQRLLEDESTPLTSQQIKDLLNNPEIQAEIQRQQATPTSR